MTDRKRKSAKVDTPKKNTLAYSADKYFYYEEAVQSVESEIDFVDETYKAIRGRRARTLREDFCGTGNTSCEWVRRRKANLAFGLDLDSDVLAWGMKHKVAQLNPGQQERIRLLNRDVLHAGCDPVDIILAMNFSYQLFKSREQLQEYFRKARQGLGNGGILFIDAYGGYDSYRVIREKTKHKNFTYYWDQEKYNPITGDMLCHIHFRFKDRSWLKKAFTYDWRLWTLPELQDLLNEVGFSNVQVYWEGTDPETGEGNGDYFATDEGEDDPSWIVYVVCQK